MSPSTSALPTPRERILAEGLFELKGVPGVGLCCVKGCRKSAENRKKKVGDLWFCAAHWQYRWRHQSPKRNAYSNLRDHAKGRGIAFSISFDYWLGLTDAYRMYDQDHKALSRGDTLTIDRVDATRGYEVGNLAIISHSENSAKSNRERHLPAHVQAILERKRAKTQGQENPWVRGEGENPF